MGWINLYWEGEMVDDGKNVCVKKKKQEVKFKDLQD